MRKLKEIEKMFSGCWRSDNGQIVYIKACEVGDNFYDYGEEPKDIAFDKEFTFLKDDFRIRIVECCDCCGCAGW